ncbi:MAG: hypothetical protein HFG79_04115 [Lachnospiraceae bacterium]|nr:hypothetical protein [Lachnospiraceae bacterium]
MAEKGELLENRNMEIFGEHFGFAFKATTYNNMIVAIRTFEQFEKKMRISFHLKKE